MTVRIRREQWPGGRRCAALQRLRCDESGIYCAAFTRPHKHSSRPSAWDSSLTACRQPARRSTTDSTGYARWVWPGSPLSARGRSPILSCLPMRANTPSHGRSGDEPTRESPQGVVRASPETTWQSTGQRRASRSRTACARSRCWRGRVLDACCGARDLVPAGPFVQCLGSHVEAVGPDDGADLWIYADLGEEAGIG